MFPTTLYRSYHFADLSPFTPRPPQTPTRNVASSHMYFPPLQSPQNIHRQNSEVYTVVGSSCNKEYSVEIRGLNEDNLEKQQVCNRDMFQNHFITLPFFVQIDLIIDIFKHLKRWFCIYGLVTLSNCLFLLKKRSQLPFPKTNPESHSLIIYLSKKSSFTSKMISQQQKEHKLIEQFLIMFGNFLLDRRKVSFGSFVVFQEFLQKLKFQNYPSLHSSKFLGSQTDFSHKNFSMTTSHLEHSESLAYESLRPKVIEKSMMMIEEKSSEYSSPKKFITASGFMDKNLSQTDLLRPENFLGVIRGNIVERKSFNCENSNYLTPMKINISPKSVSPTVKGQTSTVKRITFNYISPQPPKPGSRLQRPLSLLSLKSQQKIPQIHIRPCTPIARQGQAEQQTFRVTESHLQRNDVRQERQSISHPNFSHLNDNTSQFRSTSIEKHLNNRQVSNLKLTATTLNTYQNTSSNYISLSHHSFHRANLRNSGNSDHSYLFNNSPKNKNNDKINFGVKDQKKTETHNQDSLEPRQRKYSQVDKQKEFGASQQSSESKLYGTTHQLCLKRVKIFDVQQVQEKNKSDEKFHKISEESNKYTERNSYSMNDIENELDNLFGESQDSERNQAEIDQMLEEFENILFD